MKIESNGVFKVQGKRGTGGGMSIVMASGTTGGATITLGYYDDYGTFTALLDGLLTLGEQYQVAHGMDTVIYANVAGASGTTAISLLVNGKA